MSRLISSELTTKNMPATPGRMQIAILTKRSAKPMFNNSIQLVQSASMITISKHANPKMQLYC
jgi:hypothetical protein